MGLKGEVMELLRTADEAGLERLVSERPAAVRFLLGRLWDPDEDLRRRAANALGAAAAAHPVHGLEAVRKLMWALNDESATHGVYALPALGEIGYRNPQLMAPFVRPIAALAWDDGLRLEILRALCRIAASAPDAAAACKEVLQPHVSKDDPKERELLGRIAAWEETG